MNKTNYLGLFLLLFCFNMKSQSIEPKNYFTSNISYAFFGSGDLSGTSIGIGYKRMLYKKWGLLVSYSSSTGRGFGLGSIPDDYSFTNVGLEGDGDFAFSVAHYKSINLGLLYKLRDSGPNKLFCSGGLNFQSVINNYISSVRSYSNTREATVTQSQYENRRNVGFFLNINYTYFFHKNFGVGIQGTIENTSDILSMAGLGFSSRF